MIELKIFITNSVRRLEMWHVLFTIKNTHLNLAPVTINKMAVRFFPATAGGVNWVECCGDVRFCAFSVWYCYCCWLEGHKITVARYVCFCCLLPARRLCHPQKRSYVTQIYRKRHDKLLHNPPCVSVMGSVHNPRIWDVERSTVVDTCRKWNTSQCQQRCQRAAR